MRMYVKQVVFGLVLSLSAFSVMAGCGKKTEEIQMTEATATPTPTAMETPTPDPSISVRSTDGNIQIDLPDDTWRSLQEQEGEYVFNSPGSGSITITRNTELSAVRLPTSEDAVLDYLTDMGEDTSQMEVEDYLLKDVGTDGLQTITYTVKDTKEGRYPFITSYMILHTDGSYSATALAEKEDGALLESLQKSVVSLQVLREDHPESKVIPLVTAVPPTETPVPTEGVQGAGTPAVTQQATLAPTRTGERIILYDADTNVQTQVYALSNGEWVDDMGVDYYAEGAGQWKDAAGNVYSVDPVMQDDSGGDGMTLYYGDGSGSVYITQDAEGNWYDGQGMGYFAEGAGQWSDENGNSYSAGQ